MSVLKITLPKSRDVVISARAASALMAEGDGNAALLYIYILSRDGELSLANASRDLSLPEDEILRALKLLEKREIIGSADAPSLPERSDKVPEYTQADVAEHIGSDEAFKSLCEFVEEKLGKLLSSVDMQVLLGIYSWLGLPVDVICLLVTSCIEDTKRRLGKGRVPTMRNIEKQAKLWVREGIMTASAAEEFLKKEEKKNEEIFRISSVLNISGRALSPTEERYVSSWVALGLSEELIASAYDKTVVNTGKLTWRYMDKILQSWNDKGYKSLSEIEEKDSFGAEPRAAGDEELESVLRLRELNRKKKEK